jgi:hypothetical protein
MKTNYATVQSVSLAISKLVAPCAVTSAGMLTVYAAEGTNHTCALGTFPVQAGGHEVRQGMW